MNLLHVRSSNLFGSPERLILTQCRKLTDITSHCASFVRTGQTSRFLDECASAGIPAHAISESHFGDWRVVAHLRKIFRIHNIATVVTHDYKSTLFSYMACRGVNVSQIGYYHGRTAEDFKVRIYNTIDSFFLRRLKSVITVSDMTKKQLVARGLKAEQIHVVPNAIDRETIAPPRAPRQNANKVRLIAAGRFSFEKGYDLLIEAIAGVMNVAPPVELNFYGQGPEEEKLRALVRQFGLESTITFHGFVPDIRVVFREMDALIISSRSEGMPLVILEAWAESLGVVATAVGGIPEMVTHGESGYLVPAPDRISLQDALRAIVSDPQLLSKLGLQGRERLLSQYTSDRQAELLRRIYRGER